VFLTCRATVLAHVLALQSIAFACDAA
jgi:hypothetical protein